MCVYVLYLMKIQTKGQVGLYRSPGVQNFIYKVLGFSYDRSRVMMENI